MWESYVVYISAEEKAREAESKRMALEARLGEDLSKDSRVSYGKPLVNCQVQMCSVYVKRVLGKASLVV